MTARIQPAASGDRAGPRRLALLSDEDGHDAAARPDPIRVLIADGHALVRAGFRALLERDARMTVVGEAATGEEAVALAGAGDPDVVLLDALLPGLDCVEATRLVSGELGPAVMVLTSSEGDERMFAALRGGASGLLAKDAEPDQLVHAVDALARGETLLSPSLTRRLIAELRCRPEPACPAIGRLTELTRREREVVGLVGLGLSNDEIAARLVISPSTAKTHVSRAMIKLDARDRAGLVVFAYETGLVTPRTPAGAAGLPVARSASSSATAGTTARQAITAAHMNV
jgi:DNA-binding NarL/FixJ family response regulator